MCRSCINELSKGLLQYQNENALKEKDMESLKQEIARHESEMEQIKDEHNALHEHIKDLSNKDVDIQNYKSKYEITERNFKEYKDETERLSEHYHNENRTLLATIEEMDGLKRQALEKDEEMILMKEQIAGYKSENDTLRMQLQGLRQILSASGTGEVARELAETQEKLVVFQSYYYQILSEKNVLMEKLQNINFERVSLNQFQTTSSQFMQTQQQELSAMKRDYLLLKQNFEVEQKQSAELKLECCKLKDEKILMKKIYEQLKMDVDRMQTLEGKMLGMNMKASRLAIIADYNKQLGEKLQLEVVERDVKITELETNMIQLNNAQIENSKEKVALCVELKEVCSLNDKLNNSLEFEQQKIGELNETKKRIESTATFQLKAAVEMQKAERAALVNLLSEYKHVVEQRDGLLKSQTEYVQKISELHANVLILKNNLEATYLKLEQELETNKDLDKRLSRANEELNKIRDIPEHDEKQNELTMLKEQNQHLDASVSYLQNTIQQLNKDLDKARESEMELKRELDSELKKLEYLKKLSEEQKDVCSKQEKENRDMVLGLTNISKQYEELLHNYKHEMMVSKEKNEELEGIRRINNQQTCTIEQLQKSITEKNEEMKSLRAKHGELSSQIEDMEQSVEDFDIQAKLLSESNTKQAHLKIYLSDLHKDYERCLENTKKLEDENTNLLEQIKQYSDHAEYHCTHYKNCISEMMTQHEQDRNELVTDLETLSINFEQVKLKYRQHKQKYDDIVNQRKSLVTELLKATQMIIKEKESNVECRDKLEKSLQSNSQLVAENVQAKNEIIILTDQVDQLQTKSKEHIMEKKKLHKIIVHLENAQNQLEAEVANSKTDTKELEEKYNKLQSASNEMENELNETQRKLTIAQQLAKTMKEDLDDNHKLTMNLRSEISQLSQNLTTTEFQNAEITFRLHELQASLNTEKNINVELTAINKKIIGDILKIESGLSTSLLTPLCDFASNT
ncbi:hypothetical protein FQA39_LY05556 [Lamprigera yunnana]|nr:hypothetical protein FQA39_LY05556 [Lamprigera yunnana]